MQRPFAPPTGRLTGPQHAWETARRLGAFTIADIVGLSNGIGRSTAKTIFTAWRAAGAVEMVTPSERGVRGRLKPATWRIAEGWRKAKFAPVQRRPDYTGERGRARQQMWNAMRTLAGFTIVELAAAASTDECAISEANARAYVLALIKAARLVATRPYAKGAPSRKPGAVAGVYRLKPSANTGPKPLKAMKAGVFDPNTEKLHAYERSSS